MKIESLNILAYIIYLSICGFITIVVGRSLYKNGHHLILDLFGHEEFTKTTNTMLLVGYYLVNLGNIAINVASFGDIASLEVLLVKLSTRISFILVLLGVLHINNIIVLTRLSKRKQQIIQFFNK